MLLNDVDPMLVQCWPTICDAGPESIQHWWNASCLLGCVQPSKHNTFVEYLYNVEPTLKTLGRRCTNVIMVIFKCFVFARNISWWVLLNTAGGDHKQTPTQCLVNVVPASPVLASIHSVLVSTSCCRYLHARSTGTMLWIRSWVNVGPPSVSMAPNTTR